MPKVPLAGFWESLGGTLKKEKGWEIPALFKDFASECEGVRKNVGLIDLSHRGKIEISGKDRILFLHSLLSNDIQNVGMSSGVYATLLNAQGRVLADMNVYRFANTLLLEMESGLEKRTLERLEKLHVTEEVEIRDVTEEWILLSLQGPRSEALMSTLVHGPVKIEKEFEHANFTLLDLPATVIRRSVTGEKGFHLLLSRSKTEPAAKRILEMGRLYGVRPIGVGALEILRIEAGIPRYGIDMDETVSLPETGLDGIAASETKGCYPGQEVVARTKTYGGLQRKLSGIVFEKSNLPRTGDKIFREEKEVGFITSACHSMTLHKGIALAYLKKDFWGPGTPVTVQASQPIPAEVSPLPFYSPASLPCA